MPNKYEFPGVEEGEEKLEGVIVDEKGGVETKEGWEEELKERQEDPSRWREQK